MNKKDMEYLSSEIANIKELLAKASKPLTSKDHDLIPQCKMAKELGFPEHQFYRHIEEKRLPPPTVQLSERKYYRRCEIEEMKQLVETMDTPLSMAQMARACSIEETTFRKHVRDERLPAPTFSIEGRTSKYYLTSQIEGIKKAFLELKPIKPYRWVQDLPKRGLYTIRQAAPVLNMPRVTFQTYLDRGLLPRPKRRMEGQIWFVYNTEDVENMRTTLIDLGYYHRKHD